MAKILILDDILDAANLIKRILEKGGHEVAAFTEEDDALEHARHHSVDLAVLDIKLKKMSGLVVLAELKKLNPSLRAIMLTGYPTIETARESKTLGAGEYCVKPIDADELEDRVASVLAGDPPSALP